MEYRTDEKGQVVEFVPETEDERKALHGLYKLLDDDLKGFGRHPRLAFMGASLQLQDRECSSLTLRVYYSPHRDE